MNERIRELEAQCWEDRKYGPAWFNSEKFAELIIKECLDQCYNRGMNDELYEGQLKAAAFIEEYFNIK
jgi:hypothetical protein